MKIVKKVFWILVLIGSISLVSCSDSSNNSSITDSTDTTTDDSTADDTTTDDTPATYYVEFSGEGYGTIKWTKGFSNYGGEVPAGSNILDKDAFNFVALNKPVAVNSFISNLENCDHVFVRTTSRTVGTYHSYSSTIYIRVENSPDGDGRLLLKTGEVELTEVTDDYVKGTFTGKTPSNVIITGSFVFKKAPADSWPLSWPLP